MTQLGLGTERETSTETKARRDPKIQSGLDTQSKTSTKRETVRAAPIQSGEYTLARLQPHIAIIIMHIGKASSSCESAEILPTQLLEC